ncbi:MAG: NUDIX domain-containing protein [Cyanobacteria bacterium P01_H01_bin.15]
MTKIPVVLAVLYREGEYLLQLRDDIPTIIYPGMWAVFGGHLDPGEETAVGFRREIQEEIGYQVGDDFEQYDIFEDERVCRYLFRAELKVPLSKLTLNEGQDFGLFKPEQILTGQCFSSKLNAYRQLAPSHSQLLTTYFNKYHPD